MNQNCHQRTQTLICHCQLWAVAQKSANILTYMININDPCWIMATKTGFHLMWMLIHSTLHSLSSCWFCWCVCLSGSSCTTLEFSCLFSSNHLPYVQVSGIEALPGEGAVSCIQNWVYRIVVLCYFLFFMEESLSHCFYFGYLWACLQSSHKCAIWLHWQVGKSDVVWSPATDRASEVSVIILICSFMDPPSFRWKSCSFLWRWSLLAIIALLLLFLP